MTGVTGTMLLEGLGRVPVAVQPSPMPSADMSAATSSPEGAAPLDAPDPRYPGLSQAHVALFEAIGTPAGHISMLSTQQPDPAWLDQYLQQQILQNPEGWDQYVGNPSGTARAGIQQLMPGAALPPAGQGVPEMPALPAPGTSPATLPAVQAPVTGIPGWLGVGLGVAAGGAAVGGVLLLRGRSKAAAEAARTVVGGGGDGATWSTPPPHDLLARVGSFTVAYDVPFRDAASFLVLNEAARTGQLRSLVGDEAMTGRSVAASVRDSMHSGGGVI